MEYEDQTAYHLEREEEDEPTAIEYIEGNWYFLEWDDSRSSYYVQGSYKIQDSHKLGLGTESSPYLALRPETELQSSAEESEQEKTKSPDLPEDTPTVDRTG